MVPEKCPLGVHMFWGSNLRKNVFTSVEELCVVVFCALYTVKVANYRLYCLHTQKKPSVTLKCDHCVL